MPFYEYRCDANGRVLEVRHRMSEHMESWGALARAAGVDPGSTPEDAPVERLVSAPVPVTSSSPSGPPAAGCGPGCACAPSA
jgi:hypothetical protein